MIPSDIQHLMLEAWESVLPRLIKDPDELHTRLARRRSALFQKPFRPYCLAIKANDLRIHPYRAILTPEHAIRLDDPRHPYEYIEHTVTIDSPLVRHLTRPIHILPPGEPADEVAIKLGCHRIIHQHMRRGLFHVNYKKGLRGRRGRPVPVLYVDRWLDPGSEHHWDLPSPLWGTHPGDMPLCNRVPDGIEQTLTRRPILGAFGKRPWFKGWRWVCPGCQQPVKVIYRPLPAPMLDLESDLPPRLRRTILDCDERERGLQCFACDDCHQIQRYSPVKRSFWNVLISLFSGGLLYGKEVDRPPTFARHAVRKMTYQRKPRPCRSENHAEILRLIAETDWPLARIARHLEIHEVTAQLHAKRAYRRHNVSNLKELRQSLLAQRNADRNVQRKTA